MKILLFFKRGAGRVISFLYQKIYQKEIGVEGKIFFNNLFYILIGGGFATLCSFIFNITAGRVLGPEEYGKFTIIQSTAMFLAFPMSLGIIPALVKYASESEDKEIQSRIISTTYIFVLGLTLISSFFFLLFSSFFSQLFRISKNFFFLALLAAFLLTFYTLTTNTVRGLHKMKEYASFQAIYGAILIGSLGIFFLLKLFSFKAVLFPIYFAFGTVSLLILFLFRKYLQPKFDKQKRKILIKYSLFSFLGGIAFTFYTNVDKILINRWMETKDVGIYRAYYFASINLVWLFFNMFNIVFFPAASKYKRKKALFNQINKSIPCLIVLGVPFIFLIEGIIIKFYGSKYPVNLVWMSLFSVSAICVCLDGIYGWFFNSLGISGIKITAFAAIVLASVNIFLNVIFIPLLGITGAIIGIFIPFLVSIILMLLLGRKYVVDN